MIELLRSDCSEYELNAFLKSQKTEKEKLTRRILSHTKNWTAHADPQYDLDRNGLNRQVFPGIGTRGLMISIMSGAYCTAFLSALSFY